MLAREKHLQIEITATRNCVRVCERDRVEERQKVSERKRKTTCLYVCVYVCMCV